MLFIISTINHCGLYTIVFSVNKLEFQKQSWSKKVSPDLKKQNLIFDFQDANEFKSTKLIFWKFYFFSSFPLFNKEANKQLRLGEKIYNLSKHYFLYSYSFNFSSFLFYFTIYSFNVKVRSNLPFPHLSYSLCCGADYVRASYSLRSWSRLPSGSGSGSKIISVMAIISAKNVL